MGVRDVWREILRGVLHTLREAIQQAPAPVERTVDVHYGGTNVRYGITARVGLTHSAPPDADRYGGSSQ